MDVLTFQSPGDVTVAVLHQYEFELGQLGPQFGILVTELIHVTGESFHGAGHLLLSALLSGSPPVSRRPEGRGHSWGQRVSGSGGQGSGGQRVSGTEGRTVQGSGGEELGVRRSEVRSGQVKGQGSWAGVRGSRW